MFLKSFKWALSEWPDIAAQHLPSFLKSCFLSFFDLDDSTVMNGDDHLAEAKLLNDAQDQLQRDMTDRHNRIAAVVICFQMVIQCWIHVVHPKRYSMGITISARTGGRGKG